MNVSTNIYAGNNLVTSQFSLLSGVHTGSRVRGPMVGVGQAPL
ncbi:MAG: hypothetical protein JWR35_3849 [Marmoricola sp.]|nr:hypothetical protein [Marmoricola sp.]